jgi:2-polyprenyl-3-methyl-5-hydroxy-6-metoxy-1,4-benzoquinol methylase
MHSEILNFTKLVAPTALTDIKLFKQYHQSTISPHNWSDEELISKLELHLSELDSDITPHIRYIIEEFNNGNNIAPAARYIAESLNNTYFSCGINEEVLKTILPFDSFTNLRGVDFGFGNGEIISKLAEMGTIIEGFEKNPLFVQNARSKNLKATVADVDCEQDQFSNFGLSNSCDFAISTLILDRVNNPRKFLQNLFSVLKPTGKFAIQTLLPITGVDDGDIDEPIIYTPIEHRITPGKTTEEDRSYLINHLTNLGTKNLQIYLIPYIVASRDGVQQYNLWSFCGEK